ncbi:unnamed protein product [Spirodela intermedia]|uniref:Protein TIFY n=1 Tax=Spirodela intermedia TaxID=51605 RepID=A0A7I8J3P4_SPIIN|nr:unnamed protein product [Spirodela intermedia]CAA6664623.1 unnamed protein product [Spirodela intermedia]
MNLLPGIEDASPVNKDTVSDWEKRPKPSMVLPQRSGFGSLQSEGKPEPNREDPSSQLTIFYGGKVVVVEDFPADMAREVMAMACRGPPTPQRSSTWSSKLPPQGCCLSAPDTPPPPPSSPLLPLRPIRPLRPPVSLHRFLEKRKDRINAKAPYQPHGSSSAPPSKEEQTRRWLGLGPQAPAPPPRATSGSLAYRQRQILPLRYQI